MTLPNTSLPSYLIDLVEASEGFSATPYKDSGGVLTQGYGSTGDRVVPGSTITQDQAVEWLTSDLQAAWDSITHNSTVSLETHQIAALCDFAYNLGTGRLYGSTLWEMVQKSEFSEAAEQFGRWIYDGGIVEPGLVARREKERLMFLGDGFE